VFCHGLGLYLNYVHEYMPTGANMAVTVLDNFLKGLPGVFPADKPIPRKLAIQVDGGSENWNRVMFCYLAWLIRMGVFDEITLNRLPVGHSHTDLDGLWGVLAGGRICILAPITPTA